MGPTSPNDYEAEDDALTLVRAKSIESDAGRVQRARSFLDRKADEFAALAKQLPEVGKKPFNNSVSGSGMKPK